MNIAAIVPSAGTGKRMEQGIKKPYISLLGLPLLVYTLRALNSISAIIKIIIPVYPGEESFCEKEVLNGLTLNAEVKILSGGKTRQESVRKALDFLPDNCDMVLVHDAARPLLSKTIIENAIETTKAKGATTLGVPVKDTITMVSKDDNTISKSLPRDCLYSIQTPQTFTKAVIVNAHHKALKDGFKGTDDASLVERLGIPVTLIRGSYTNIKITTQEDLLFAEAVLIRMLQ